MARIVLGLGTSHSPQLSSPPDIWHDHVARDRVNSLLIGPDGKVYHFDELPPTVDESKLSLEAWQQVLDRTDRAIDRLHEAFEQAHPDVVLIVGDDQEELFLDDGIPAVAIFWGEALRDLPPTKEKLQSIPAGIRAAHWAIHGDQEEKYLVSSDLGRHLIERLMLDEFDVSQLTRQPRDRGLGHAFTFVMRRIMRDRAVPIVPVLLNTYMPPNQPTPRRCFALGRSLRAAVESYPGDLRVAIVASGGLSHFIVDEQLDRRVLDGLASSDQEVLTTIPRCVLRSGSSEILAWITVGGAVEGMDMETVDYVPGYRSAQGTGVGMAFSVWR